MLHSSHLLTRIWQLLIHKDGEVYGAVKMSAAGRGSDLLSDKLTIVLVCDETRQPEQPNTKSWKEADDLMNDQVS